MMLRFLIVSLVFLPGTLFSQSEEDIRSALNTIDSFEDAENLKKDQPNWTIVKRKVLPVGITYDSLIFHSNVSDVLEIQKSEGAPKIIHKIVGKGSEEVCKVNYIYLDGKRRSIQEINSLRAQIINAYKDGTPFINLVRRFSEDGNATGTLDWFYEGMMDETFDAAVRPKPAGTIFTVDVPQRYWYYVVLKSEPNKELPCTYSVSIHVNE